MNEWSEQINSELVEVWPWKLVDSHVLHVWEMPPISVIKTIPMCNDIVYRPNPTSPHLVGKKVCIDTPPWWIPHLHDLIDFKPLTCPSLLESGWELEAFHFLDLLICVKWIEVVSNHLENVGVICHGQLDIAMARQLACGVITTLLHTDDSLTTVRLRYEGSDRSPGAADWSRTYLCLRADWLNMNTHSSSIRIWLIASTVAMSSGWPLLLFKL